jgi:hypothetical protein
VFAAAHVVNLFPHEFAGLGGCGLALASIAAGAAKCFFLRHSISSEFSLRASVEIQVHSNQSVKSRKQTKAPAPKQLQVSKGRELHQPALYECHLTPH